MQRNRQATTPGTRILMLLFAAIFAVGLILVAFGGTTMTGQGTFPPPDLANAENALCLNRLEAHGNPRDLASQQSVALAESKVIAAANASGIDPQEAMASVDTHCK